MTIEIVIFIVAVGLLDFSIGYWVGVYQHKKHTKKGLYYVDTNKGGIVIALPQNPFPCILLSSFTPLNIA